MNARTLAAALLVVAAGLTGCSTTRSGGEAVDGGSSTTADPSATDLTTTTVATSGTPGTETPVETTAPGTVPATVATTAAPPATPAPTTIPCRNVPTLFVPDLALDSVDVRRGDCGQGVKDVQDQLNYRAAAGLAVDGRFGPATEAAVRDFQTSVGLPATGVVNGNTWVALVDDGT